MNENVNEIKTHPKKPTLLEEYIKRHRSNKEKYFTFFSFLFNKYFIIITCSKNPMAY